MPNTSELNKDSQNPVQSVDETELSVLSGIDSDLKAKRDPK
ncbi:MULTISPECIES: hypothetical protein [unclassified Peribacillus]